MSPLRCSGHARPVGGGARRSVRLRLGLWTWNTTRLPGGRPSLLGPGELPDSSAHAPVSDATKPREQIIILQPDPALRRQTISIFN